MDPPVEIVNSQSVVNRWLVDYYLFLALELFQKKQYAEFCAIRDVLKSVLVRPVMDSASMPTKIRVLQFLSWINESERLGEINIKDTSLPSDQSLSPLESALMLLEQMNQECSIPQQDYENVCTSLKEMIVQIFIKNNEFDKAKEVLNKHFPKPMVGKKAIFMGLIRQQSKTHKVIEQMDFKQFKEEMLAFCQKLCPFKVPFLHKAATQLIDKMRTELDDEAAEEEEEPGPSSIPQIHTIQFVPCKHSIIQRIRLELAYKALAAGSDKRTFAQLEEEVEREGQPKKDHLSLHLSPTPKKGTKQALEQDGLFQRDSGSPMEASPADQPPHTDAVPQTQAGSLSTTPSVLRNRRLYTVAQLVVEPDSQGGSQCTTASQEQEAEVGTEEPPQSQAIPSEKDQQNPVTDHEVTTPTRKRFRRASKICSRASTSWADLSADSEEESPGSVANGETCVEKLHNQSNSSLRGNSRKSIQLSSDSEEDPQEAPAPCTTPVQKPQKQLASNPLSRDAGNTGEIGVPRKSSTPHKDSQDKGPYLSKWKQLCRNAKESKDTWSDEESYFTSRKKSGSHNESTISNSGHRKRKWTESETNMLKEGVKKFGEGNWSKIQAYYSFEDRTNINLKDRWRTLKKANMV